VAPPNESRCISWAERVVLLVLISFFSVHTLPRAWNGLVTDFPNYYLAAQLTHDGFETSRMYEWQWLEREKDHRDIPIRVIGLVPITPFSTLFAWPLTALKPLAAKRIWIVLTLALLFPISWLLRMLTGLSYQRIALLFALSFPLYRNVEFGQFYVLLLLLIVAACWAALRGHVALAGALIAVAAAAKMFPVVLFVFFLQRRRWRALGIGALVGAASIILSIGAFGWSAHRTYLEEILPWTLRGEAMPPYVVNASISGILHVLFLPEPQWNPHPWHSSPLAFSILMPLLQMLLLAPAILLIRRDEFAPNRILLEWSALLTALLTISTIPASYNFVLMVLPVGVVAAILLEQRRYGWLAALLIAYIGVGFPMPNPPSVNGLAIFLYTPRLPLMIAMLLGIYRMLLAEPAATPPVRDWSRAAWATAMTVSMLFTAHSIYVRERAVRREYAYRLPVQHEGYLNASPQFDGENLRYIAFTLDGYHLMTSGGDSEAVLPSAVSTADELSFTSAAGMVFAERADVGQSRIIALQHPEIAPILDGRDPALAVDGQSLAFVRDDHGHGRLMVRSALGSSMPVDTQLTPAYLNVFEVSYRSPASYAFAASTKDARPTVYIKDTEHSSVAVLDDSRYPALSPDGRWLAYSHFESGAWNLWLRNQSTGATRSLGNVPCNEIQPSWEADSKTLLYSTDCGRSLWFTAIARRSVIQ
jgi:hypothetical protein